MERPVDASAVEFQASKLGDGILASGEVVGVFQEIAESAEVDTWSPVDNPALKFRRRPEEAGGGTAEPVVDLRTNNVVYGKSYGEYSLNGVPRHAAPVSSVRRINLSRRRRAGNP